MEYQAELRVYQPLAAFPDAAQVTFQRAGHLPREQVEATAARESERRLLRDVTDPFPHRPDLVRVLRVPAESGSGVSEFYCPDEIALRCELAAVQLAESMRPQIFSLVVPPTARRANLDRVAGQLTEQDRVHGPGESTGPDGAPGSDAGHDPDSDPDRGPGNDPEEDAEPVIEHVHTRTAVWGVPAAWFALFSLQDPASVFTRETEGTESTESTEGTESTRSTEDPEDQDGPRSTPTVRTARVTTPLTAALERGRRAAVVMSLHAPNLDMLDDVTALVAWLQSFHPDSMVELDYGGLAPLVWPDDSAFDVQTAVDALEEGDTASAVLANHRMVRRWLAVRQLGRAS